MAGRIVVATDGGEASAAAVRWVAERAKGTEFDVELTTVAETEADRAAHEQVLASGAQSLEAAAPGRVTTRLRTGSPAHALIAASQDAKLEVIGTNKTGAAAGIVHGTLPLRVAGRARCPVAVVPADWKPGGKRVVVGWDSDGTGDVALEFAAGEAKRLGLPLTVVHAWRIPPIIGEESGSLAAVTTELEEAHRDDLAGAAARIRTAHPNLDVTESLAVGPPAIAIVTAARDAALVVVGSHGRGALGGLVLGSVSHDVLMNMPSVVVVVPSDGKPIEVLPEILDEDLI
jgi:nucleotide-binding universal stress UspA family protein